MERLNRLSDVAEHYDAVLCDVWGVIHNGVEAWPEAWQALAAMRAKGLSVVLITNAPRPWPRVHGQLGQLGVPERAYDRIVTSGDVTRRLIEEAHGDIFLLGPERDVDIVSGLGVNLVKPEEADVVVCTGLFDDETETPDHYRELLENFRARNLPMICANPDLVVERGNRLVYCAGAIAALYEKMGGETRVSGKPFAPMYERALEVIGELRGGPVESDRVIAIGDGMPTDVKGATDFGIDLLYISGGIHARDYTSNDAGVDERKLEQFLAEHGARPRYWMPELQ